MEITQNKLFVKQQVEMIEIFTGFETENKYSILDESGKEVFFAFEESNMAIRRYARKMGPITINVIDNQKNVVLTFRRKMSFMFPTWEIEMGNQLIGTIRRRFAFFKTKYSAYDTVKKVQFDCIAKMFHPWTFNITRGEQKIGLVSKKWSGLSKEMFTDADSFGVDFMGAQEQWLKAMIFAIAFIIDEDIFESDKSSENLEHDVGAVGKLLSKARKK